MKIPLSKLVDNPFNERKTVTKEHKEGLVVLADQMKQHGFLGSLVARPQGAKYEIAFGSRRLKAAKLAGLTEIEVEVKELTDKQMQEISTGENVHRTAVNTVDRAHHVIAYMNKYKLNKKQVAAVFGLQESRITDFWRCTLMSPKTQQLLREKKIGIQAASRLYLSGKDRLIQGIVQNYPQARYPQLQTLAVVLNNLPDDKQKQMVDRLVAGKIDPADVLISGLKYAIPHKTEKTLDSAQLRIRLSRAIKDGVAALEVLSAQWNNLDESDQVHLGIDVVLMMDKLNQTNKDLPQLISGK